MIPPITLTTDFGLENEFVGVMKGVILSICPNAVIVDISHSIRPQDVMHAAAVVKASSRYFPRQTVHVVVVDPGVGTQRRIIAMESGRHVFLAPDNGVLTPCLAEDCQAFIVSNTGLFLEPVSATFHGRDIFAPVAAHLAAGTPLNEVGPRVPAADLVSLSLPEPSRIGGCLHGSIMDIDRFGNLITNISTEDIDAYAAGALADIIITINKKEIRGVSRTYGDKRKGEPVVVMGSRDLLEIAINQGNAADYYAAAVYQPVYLSRP